MSYPAQRLMGLLGISLGLTFVGCGGGAGGGAALPTDNGSGDTALVDIAGGLPPEIVIISPNDGLVVSLGDSVDFTATVSDDRDDPTEIDLHWSSDKDGVFNTNKASATGMVTFETTGLSGANHEITLRATDTEGRVASVSVTLIVNALPGAPLIAIEPKEATSSDDLLAVIVEDALDVNRDATELSYEYVWYRDGDSVGLATEDVSANLTARGEQWQVVVTANDGFGVGLDGTASVMIGNSPPVCNNAIVLPTAGGTDMDFTCKCIDWQDADAGDKGQDHCVFRDGLSVVTNSDPQADSCVLDASATSKGMALVCELTPSDGIDDGDMIETEAAQVLNTAPTAPLVSMSPTEGSVETIFSCTVAGSSDDIDGDALVYETTWVVNGYENPGTTTTMAQPKQLVASAAGDPVGGGDTLVCRIRAYDGSVKSQSSDSVAVVLGNSPPSGGTVLVSPFEVSENDVIQCSASGAVDADGDMVTWVYQWFVNDAPVDGVTSDTLDGTHFDKGDSVYCKAAPFDGQAQGAYVAAKNKSTVINSLPMVVSASLAPEEVDRSGTLTCTYDGWSDADPGDAETVEWAWYVVAIDGSKTPIIGATSSTLSASTLTPGETVVCTVTPVDSDGQGGAVESNTAVVINAIPSVQDALLTPPNATESDVLVCTPSGWSDADGDAPGYEFGWLVNGVEVVGQTSGSLTGEFFSKGMQVICVATPFDGYATGMAVYSNPVFVDNSTPSITGVLLSPPFGGQQTPFVCGPQGENDADGDNVVYTFKWFHNETLIAGETSGTLQGLLFQSGDKLRCEATPFDGLAYGDSKQSNSVSLFNNPPSVGTVIVEPIAPVTSTELTCTPSGWNDPEGDPPQYEYQWFVDAQPAVGQTTNTLAGDHFSKGQAVSCRATPTDGLIAGASVLSASVTILNSTPSYADVMVTPLAGNKTSEFTCEGLGWSDADNDPEMPQYQWLLDGLPLPEQQLPTITPTMMTPGQALTCRLTPFDGQEAGSSLVSAPVQVVNNPPTITLVELGPTPAYTNSTLVCTPKGWSDPDNDAPGYIYEWLVNSNPVVGEVGATLIGSYFSKKQKVYCSVTPFDGEKSGNTLLSNGVTIANTPPKVTVANLTPKFGNKYATYTCSASGVVDDDLDSVQYKTTWWINGTEVVDATAPAFQGNGVEPGDQLRCNITPYDGEDTGATVISDVSFIINNPPSLTGAVIEPSPLYSDTPATCVPQGWSDSDGELEQVVFEWSVNGTTVPGATGSTLSVSAYNFPDQVVCSATPVDGYDSGAAVVATIGVSNTPPSIGAVWIEPALPTVVTGLTCHWSDFEDLDGAADQSTVAWSINGQAVGTGVSLAGTAYQKGDTVTCTVTPNDNTDAGTPLESSALIINATPTIGSVDLTPTTGGKLDVFTCAPQNAADPDGDAVSFSTVWKRNGQLVPGQTAGTWQPSTAVTVGDEIACEVRAFDGTVYSDALLSGVATILNYAPSLTGALLGPAGAITSTDLTCLAQDWMDADGDPETVTYGWLVNGSALSGEAGSGLSNSHFTRSDSVQCTATPMDAFGTGAAVQSNVLTIVNALPVLASVAVNPPTGNRYTTFACDASGGFDADGDTVQITYEWLVDGNAVAGQTGTSYTPSDQDPGSAIQCRVTPNDGFVDGLQVVSQSVVLTNTPPTISTVELTPVNANTTHDLTCDTTGVADPDGDPVNVIFQWYADGAVVVGQTGAMLGNDHTESGTQVSCSATPSDGFSTGPTLTSGTVSIQNTPPGMPTLAIEPAPAGTMHDLVCTITVPAYDPDGDNLFNEFSWYKDDELQPQFTTNSIAAASTDECTNWRCEVRSSDGTAWGPTGSAESQIHLGGTPQYGARPYQDGARSTFLTPGFGVGTGNWTFEFWIMTYASNKSGALYFTRGGDIGAIHFRYDAVNQWVRAEVVNTDTSNPDAVLYSGVVGGGAWHHVALVHTNGQLRMFTDGEQVDAAAVTPNLQAGGVMTLGRPVTGPDLSAYVVVGPTRFSKVDRYANVYMPLTKWLLDDDTVAQYFTANPFSTSVVPDVAGGDNNGQVEQGFTSYWNPKGSDTYSDCTDFMTPTAPEVMLVQKNNYSYLECRITKHGTTGNSLVPTYTTRWYKNGVLQPALTSTTTTTILNTVFNACEQWQCTATPTANGLDGPETFAPQTVNVPCS